MNREQKTDWLVTGLAVVCFIFMMPLAVTSYTDWLWSQEVGYEHVFLRGLIAKATIFATVLAVGFLFLFANLRLANRPFGSPWILPGTSYISLPATDREQRHTSSVALACAAIAAMLAGSEARDWLTWLMFFNSTPFGDLDPIFGRDVGFYVFRLPAWRSLAAQALTVTIVSIVGSGFLYTLSGSVVMESRTVERSGFRLRFVPAARRHLVLLVALAFALLACSSWLTMAETLLTPGNVIHGASYVDVHGNLTFLRVRIAVLVLGAGLAIWRGFDGRRWAIPVAIGLYISVSIVGGAYAHLIQRFVVKPNESLKEEEFIRHNIAATRRAYALDQIQEYEFSGDSELTANQVIDHAVTFQNVRLWDSEQLLQTFSQLQEIRTYYAFLSVHNDRYRINDKERQVMISVRELNTKLLPAQSFVNERLTFTHGYGVTLGPVNQVTPQGLPMLFIQNVPPVTTADIPLTEPSIYFGEQSSDYVLVRTNTPEFHYPRGTDNVTTYYQGAAGVPIGSFWRRLVFSLRFGTTDILLTSQIGQQSRIIFHRKIGDRVAAVAPFLTTDKEPYPVIYGGRVHWIQDAYTATANYPYATPSSGSARLNYIRNSVKIVVDAYDGTTTLYLADPDDPIARTIAKIFPGLLRPLDAMPVGLQQHLRYPNDMLRIQASMYATYHMTSPAVFYNKEDEWQIPVLETDRNAMTPYYTTMRLPGETQPEFVQILAFTPRKKDNLSAWMAARSDPNHYGQLLVWRLPKDKVVYGPRQVAGRINQDQAIAPQITLWNQQGSEVQWGTLLVVPIDDALLYIRPLYLKSPSGKIAELKRVVVAYQGHIVMDESLRLALISLFGEAVANVLPDENPALPPSRETTAELVSDAVSRWQQAGHAIRSGDFTQFGREWASLGELLQKITSVAK